METTTQPQRQMLRRFCTLSRVVGWTMIVMGGLGAAVNTFGGWIIAPQIGLYPVVSASVEGVGQVFTGLAVLVLVQFICYIVEEGTEPRWLLRNGHIILCLLALSLILLHGVRFWPHGWNSVGLIFACSPEQTIPMDRRLVVASVMFTAYLPVLTKVLCVLGIAAALRTVLPIMAESKTLA